MTRRKQRIVIQLVALPIVAAIFYITLRLIGAWIIPQETTDLTDYQTTLKDWSTTDYADHFPKTVPMHAKQVRFSAFPGFLQGGAYIQLRLQLPAGEVEQIEAKLKQATTHIYEGGGFFERSKKDQSNEVPATSFRTADNPATELKFPSHYRLYVLKAEDRGAWNHGTTRGVVVSTTVNEVVYWAENW